MMQSFPPTYILRHRRENLKKCSLRDLELKSGFQFFTYPTKLELPDLSSYLLLAFDGPPLKLEDSNHGLFILDATWRYTAKMRTFIESKSKIETRSLPAKYCTAYPRRQEDCPYPKEGLASIEAIYIAYKILGRDISGLLDHYRWKQEFLIKNFF